MNVVRAIASSCAGIAIACVLANVAACTTEITIGLQADASSLVADTAATVDADADASIDTTSDTGVEDGGDAADTAPEADAEPIVCGEGEAPCPDGQFCNFEITAACGVGKGVCTTPPTFCPGPVDRVCGCDGITYSTACDAAQAKVSVYKLGECTDKTCGGFIPAMCDLSEFCAWPLASGCGKSDATATCKPRPGTCPKVDAPVCACNGKTYDNECAANRDGLAILHTGACP